MTTGVMQHRNRLSSALLMVLLGSAGLAPAAESVLFNFVRPLDSVQVTLKDAVLPDLQAETNGQGEILRRVTFNPAAQPTLSLTPAQGSWDWSQQGAMSLRLQNAMAWDLTLLVRIESLDGQQLLSRVAVPAGPAQTLLVPLQATAPIAQGMRAAPPMPWRHNGQSWLVATEVSGQLDARQIKRVELSLEQPQAAQSLLLGRFGSQPEAPLAAVYADLIDAYGQSTPIVQLGTVNVPEPRMVTINIWDKAMVGKVEKAIRESGLGINPQLNGTIIMLPIPELNEQRRKELAKVAAQYAESAKVAIRNVRRDGMDQIKKAKAAGMGEDDQKMWSEEVQDLTDKAIALVDKVLESKQQEIMQV